METAGFHLDLVIVDAELTEWLEELPEKNVQQEVEAALKAGHFILSLLSVQSGQEAMERFFQPVGDKIDELKTTLNEIMRAQVRSQSAGQMGESITVQQLKQSFPTDDIQLHSGKGHQADIGVTFDAGAYGKIDALVEVKLYTNDVGGQEVEKFRKDLVTQNVRYGLMVSMTSRIMTIPGPFHLETTEDFVAVYVPESGIEGHGAKMGFALLKAIALFEAARSRDHVYSRGDIERAWNAIQKAADAFRSQFRVLRGLKTDLRKMRDNMTNSVDGLTERITEIEMDLEREMFQLSQGIQAELIQLSSTEGTPALVAASQDEIVSFVDGFSDQYPKLKSNMTALIGQLQENDCTISIGQDALSFSCRNGISADVTWNQSKIKVSFPIPETQKTLIDIGIEKLSATAITIEIVNKNREAALLRIAERISSIED